jgi:hypothetical protein
VQKRVGKNEQVLLNKALASIHKFNVYKQHKARGETFFNHLLIQHLRQGKVPVKNQSIHPAKLFGERFLPECFLAGSGVLPLFAIECKKLTDTTAKGRWKQGVSQAILYSHCYKAVALVLYDYTKGATYTQALALKRSPEAAFAESLREAFRIYVIAVPALRDVG